MRLFIYISIFILFSSCVKDYFDFDKLSTEITWNPTVAVPAVHSKLTLRDIIQDYDYQHLFVEDSTAFLYLIYNKEVFSYPAINYINIPTQSASINYNGNEFISSGFPIISPVTVTKSTEIIFQPPNSSDEIDSIILKNGTLSVSINSTFLHNGEIKITFPTIKKNGFSYSKTINVPSSYSGVSTFNDLQGYTIYIYNNQIKYNIEYTLYNSGNPVTPGDQTSIEVSLNNLQYKIIYGLFASRNIDLYEDTVELEIFKNAKQGHLYFVNPKIKFIFKNSFGVPLQSTIQSFKIYSTTDNTYYHYQVPSQYNPLDIMYPTMPTYTALTKVILDTLNFPDIRNIIYNNPQYIYVKTQPQIVNSTHQNFIIDTSKISLNVEVELPLWGKSGKWVLQDTTDFDFEKLYNDSDNHIYNIEFVKFNVFTVNNSPAEAIVQIYLTDTLYNVIDSLFNYGDILHSGVLDHNGKVIQATSKQTQTTYTGPRLQGLLNVKKALIRATLITAEHGNRIVKFYATNYVDVKIGVMVKAKFNTYYDF
ncbi:MAG: hypothetical protein N3A01_03585 [Bacteroidales bacterium]|nr:hypothetical protein [Bacteroidales bacterium]